MRTLGGEKLENRSETDRHSEQVRVNPHKLHTARACGLGSKSSARGETPPSALRSNDIFAVGGDHGPDSMSKEKGTALDSWCNCQGQA